MQFYQNIDICVIFLKLRSKNMFFLPLTPFFYYKNSQTLAYAFLSLILSFTIIAITNLKIFIFSV